MTRRDDAAGADAAARDDDDDAALYDRQIRLYGLHGQQRLRRGRVALVLPADEPTPAAHTVSYEVAKNLVIGGIGALSLSPVCAAARWIAGEVAAMNAGGVVVVVTARPAADADVVVGAGLSVPEQRALEAQQHARTVCGVVHGLGGYAWANLGTARWVQGGDRHDVTFPASALAAAAAADVRALDARRTSRWFFALRLLWAWEDAHARAPGAGDGEALAALAAALQLPLSPEWVAGTLARAVAAPALSPVSAVLGGYVAQEVIRVFTATEAPNIRNWLFFDGAPEPESKAAGVVVHRFGDEADAAAAASGGGDDDVVALGSSDDDDDDDDVIELD